MNMTSVHNVNFLCAISGREHMMIPLITSVTKQSSYWHCHIYLIKIIRTPVVKLCNSSECFRKWMINCMYIIRSYHSDSLNAIKSLSIRYCITSTCCFGISLPLWTEIDTFWIPVLAVFVLFCSLLVVSCSRVWSTYSACKPLRQHPGQHGDVTT